MKLRLASSVGTVIEGCEFRAVSALFRPSIPAFLETIQDQDASLAQAPDEFLDKGLITVYCLHSGTHTFSRNSNTEAR
jgi:hypothetical protein